MSNVAYRGRVPGLFQTLLGSALPVSEYWADLYEPWQPNLEKLPPEPQVATLPLDNSVVATTAFPTPNETVGGQLGQAIARRDDDRTFRVQTAAELKFADDGTETISDALPDPVLIGQQYAAGGRPGRRGGGPPETPVGRFLSGVYEGKIRALSELEPNNKLVTQFRAPDWRPSQRDIDRIEEELIRAPQRAPGAIDTQASGIGIGPFARESLPARSESRFFNEQERAEGNRLGELWGCHTCGTRDPGTTSGNFVLDHQQPTRLNPPGQAQRLFPQCLSCMYRQGGLIAREITREKP